jgi:predicted nucleic acid-binding protein
MNYERVGMPEYFYDTYAIFEYLKGNKKYQKYFKEPLGITTKLNLMELYYGLLNDEEYADEIYASFLSIVIDLSDAQIKKGMKMRKELKDKGLNISYVDALGYSISKERKIKFLTGDKEFKNLPNVEYVK